MKAGTFAFFCIVLLLCTVCLTPACGAGGPADAIQTGDWLWDPSNVNSFTGILNLSDYVDTELNIRLSALFESSEELPEASAPVFTVVNGNRVRMVFQSDTFQFTPTEEQPVFDFTATLKMPEKGHAQKIVLTVTACDRDDKELKNASAVVSLYGGSQGSSSRAVFIPYDIRTITIILAAVAALSWAAALVRNRVFSRRK